MAENTEFDQLISNSYYDDLDTSPYENGPAVKPGLTGRGKLALTVGAVALAASTVVGYSIYADSAAEKALAAKELEIKSQQLEVKKLRALNEISASKKKAASSAEKERRAELKDCVDGLSKKLDSGLDYQAISACKELHPAAPEAVALNDAAPAANPRSGQGSEGSISPSALLALGAGGAIAVAVAARRNKKTAEA